MQRYVLICLLGLIFSCTCPQNDNQTNFDKNATFRSLSSVSAKVDLQKIAVPKPPNGYKVLVVNVFDEQGKGISGASINAACPNGKSFDATQLTEGLYYITLPEECFSGGYITASKPSENRPAQTKVLSFERSSVNFVLIKNRTH